jgi:hypothetical protein
MPFALTGPQKSDSTLPKDRSYHLLLGTKSRSIGLNLSCCYNSTVLFYPFPRNNSAASPEQTRRAASLIAACLYPSRVCNHVSRSSDLRSSELLDLAVSRQVSQFGLQTQHGWVVFANRFRGTRYLQESGKWVRCDEGEIFNLGSVGHGEAAVKLQRDWTSDPQRLPCAQHIKPHALIVLVQKGLQYHEIEQSIVHQVSTYRP